MSIRLRHPRRVVRRLLVAVALAGVGATARPLAAQPSAAPDAAAPNASRDRWADSAARAVEAATARNDAGALAGVRAVLGRALALTPNDPLLQHYQGYAAYREAVARLAAGDKAGARRLLDEADGLLDRSGKRMPLAETFALRSAVIGMQIGTGNPASGMWLGPRSNSAMDRAVALGPRNPRVWLLRGVGAFNAPSMWGGGNDKARDYLTRALALFAGDRPAAPMPAWGEAEAHVWMGRTLQRAGDAAGARAAYARALALQPDNAWVSRVLVPSLDAAPGGAAR